MRSSFARHPGEGDGRSTWFRQRLLLTVLSTFLPLLLTGATSVEAPAPAPTEATNPTSPLNPAGQAFISTALHNGRRELQMAQLGIGRAMRSEVRSFAQKLAADHGRLNNALTALAQRKGVAVTAQANSTGDGAQELTSKSGAAFDRAFILVMLAAHNDAVSLFEKTLSEVKDTGVREVVGTYLPVLRDHLNTAKALKEAAE